MKSDIELKFDEIKEKEFKDNLEAILKSNGTDKESIRQMSMFLAVIRIEHPEDYTKFLEDYCEAVMYMDNTTALEIAKSLAQEYKPKPYEKPEK